jgi:hypothetical protein
MRILLLNDSTSSRKIGLTTTKYGTAIGCQSRTCGAVPGSMSPGTVFSFCAGPFAILDFGLGISFRGEAFDGDGDPSQCDCNAIQNRPVFEGAHWVRRGAGCSRGAHLGKARRFLRRCAAFSKVRTRNGASSKNGARHETTSCGAVGLSPLTPGPSPLEGEGPGVRGHSHETSIAHRPICGGIPGHPPRPSALRAG